MVIHVKWRVPHHSEWHHEQEVLGSSPQPPTAGVHRGALLDNRSYRDCPASGFHGGQDPRWACCQRWYGSWRRRLIPEHKRAAEDGVPNLSDTAGWWASLYKRGNNNNIARGN